MKAANCAGCGAEFRVRHTEGREIGWNHASRGGDVAFECKECHRIYCMHCARYSPHEAGQKNSWGGSAFYCESYLTCLCVNTSFNMIPAKYGSGLVILWRKLLDRLTYNGAHSI
jgi:hypothetical protein